MNTHSIKCAMPFSAVENWSGRLHIYQLTKSNFLFQPTIQQFCKHRFLTMNNNFAMNRFLSTVLFTTQRSRKFSKWSYCPRWRKEDWRNKGLSCYIALKCSSPVLNPAFYIHIGSQRTTFSGGFPSIKKDLPVKIPLIHFILACWEFSSISLVTPSCSSLFCIIILCPFQEFIFWWATAAAFFYSSPPSFHLPNCKTTFHYYNLISGLFWHDLLKHNWNFTAFHG